MHPAASRSPSADHAMAETPRFSEGSLRMEEREKEWPFLRGVHTEVVSLRGLGEADGWWVGARGREQEWPFLRACAGGGGDWSRDECWVPVV